MLIEFLYGDKHRHIISSPIGDQDTVEHSTTGITDKAKVLKHKAYEFNVTKLLNWGL